MYEKLIVCGQLYVKGKALLMDESQSYIMRCIHFSYYEAYIVKYRD